MCVRAIDYLPPVEFEFPDFLAALLVSDAEIVPDDKHGYRVAVRDAFARWGIADADDHIADLSRSGLTAVYRNLSYTALRSDTDEVFRFIWENLELLQIDPRFYLHVEHVRPSVRVGPDGIAYQAEAGGGDHVVVCVLADAGWKATPTLRREARIQPLRCLLA